MRNKITNMLLIEDNKATNFVNTTIIKRSEYVDNFLVAENGEEALKILKDGYIPDFILLDINMPVMNGWDFLSEFFNLYSLSYKGKIIIMLGEELSDNEYSILSDNYQITTFNKKILDKDALNNIINLN